MLKLVHCSYSFGLGNGIAHADTSLLEGVDRSKFSVKAFVIRPDFPSGHYVHEKLSTHISLVDAYDLLCKELPSADIVQVNGSLDPVVVHAAAASGVPAIVEVMHNVEPGGLHEATDIEVCVSPLVQSVQCHPHSYVIPNGIDCHRFFFKEGRRHKAIVKVAQVSNAAKVLDIELADMVTYAANPTVFPLMVGNRAQIQGIPSLGVVRDMPAVYHDVDLLFVIEQSAAFGLVFAEAMACGTLPIISVNSGATAFVEHGKTGWIIDPGSQAAAIQIFLEAVATVGDSHFLAMQKEAREKIARHFSVERMVAMYQDLWTELGIRPRRPARKPDSWMPLAVGTMLCKHDNPASLLFLNQFLSDTRLIEGYFLRHPVGQAIMSYLLTDMAPKLLKQGENLLVLRLCSKLRQSRCFSPLLTEIERKAENDL